MDDTEEFEKSHNEKEKQKQKEKEKQRQKNWELLKQAFNTLLYTIVYGVASREVGPGLVCFVARKIGYNLDHRLQ